jgi:hypothetical protein
MRPAYRFRSAVFIASVLARVLAARGSAAELATAPPEELLRVYAQLRQLKAGDPWAAAERVSLRRDAATFTFTSGRLHFAAPVEGHVLAAAFEGQGVFEFNPPTPIDRRQLSRFTRGAPKLEDPFRKAVFFFTDDSWGEFQKLVKVQTGGTPTAHAPPGFREIADITKPVS